jgi:hypothetical protein
MFAKKRGLLDRGKAGETTRSIRALKSLQRQASHCKLLYIGKLN